MADETDPVISSGIRQRTHESVDKIIDKAESIGESGKERIAELRGKAVMMKGDFEGYIQNNPEKSVLIAAGIGAVVGAMLTAAMLRRKQ
jgi:ElaB/YqjD/DUF883 family membrane-anchored ribosome-binding protein